VSGRVRAACKARRLQARPTVLYVRSAERHDAAVALLQVIATRKPVIGAPKLVAISGFGQPGDLHNAYEAGFDLHLTKPISPKFLHDVMNALTSKGQVKG
jgi:CheY-like chemotaxis protein